MIFYRYRKIISDPDRCYVQKELQENNLRCAQLSELNDAYEGIIKMKLHEKEYRSNFEDYRDRLKVLLENVIKSSEKFNVDIGVSSKELMNSLNGISSVKEIDIIYEIIYKVIINKVLEYRDVTRICCFSDNNESELMWSHYADGMKGVCIGYKFDDEVILSPVSYDNELKVFDLDEVVSIFTNPSYHEDGFLHDVYRSRISKSNNWSYEKEYRLITDKEFYPYRRESLEEIVFGFRAARDSVYSVLNKLESLGYNVKLGVAFLSPEKRNGINVRYMTASKLKEFFESQDASKGYYDDLPLERSFLNLFYSL